MGTDVDRTAESTKIHHRRSSPGAFLADANALATTLAWLRPCAAIGQLLAVIVAVEAFHLTLPVAPLLGGIALLAIATPIAFWRLHHSPCIREPEAVAYVIFDLLMIAWALHFTGGIRNPFITMLLVPVALSAAALSWRGAAAVVAAAAVFYLLLTFLYVPLPRLATAAAGNFGLYLTGMSIDFGIALLLLVVFAGRMTAALDRQREAVRRLRERELRDEGVLAIATQAAQAAHRLNTPLSTLRTLLAELPRGCDSSTELQADVSVMLGEVERCRETLRAMVDYGRQQLSDTVRATTLGAYLDSGVDRFRLLRPEAEVAAEIGSADRDRPVRIEAGLDHALFNLMQNALDASLRNDSHVVAIGARVRNRHVEFAIDDHGDGFPSAPQDENADGTHRNTDGLGIGLLLARVTIERLHGELAIDSSATGTRVTVRVPLLEAA